MFRFSILNQPFLGYPHWWKPLFEPSQLRCKWTPMMMWHGWIDFVNPPKNRVFSSVKDDGDIWGYVCVYNLDITNKWWLVDDYPRGLHSSVYWGVSGLSLSSFTGNPVLNQAGNWLCMIWRFHKNRDPSGHHPFYFGIFHSKPSSYLGFK